MLQAATSGRRLCSHQDDPVGCTFLPGRATLLRRRVGSRAGVAFDIEFRTDIADSRDNDTELRRVSLTNHLTERNTNRSGGTSMTRAERTTGISQCCNWDIVRRPIATSQNYTRRAHDP